MGFLASDSWTKLKKWKKTHLEIPVKWRLDFFEKFDSFSAFLVILMTKYEISCIKKMTLWDQENYILNPNTCILWNKSSFEKLNLARLPDCNIFLRQLWILKSQLQHCNGSIYKLIVIFSLTQWSVLYGALLHTHAYQAISESAILFWFYWKARDKGMR